MKKLITVLLIAFIGCNETSIIQPEAETESSQRPFVSLYIENGQFSGDTTYSFEVYASSNVPGLAVGNTTIALYAENEFYFSALRNPKLTYVNPKYTLGSPGYYPMYVAEYYEKEKKEFGMYLQIVHLQNQGEGSILNQTKEKIAVITCDVKFCVFDMEYDNNKTIFLKPNYERVLTGNYGTLEGCH